MTLPPGPITWIKVEKPVFDLVGVVLSSLTAAGLAALLALGLGLLLGIVLIVRDRRRPLPEGMHLARRRRNASRHRLDFP